MKRLTKKYLIPHKGNEYTPHLLRGKGILLVTALAILIPFGALIHTRVITETDFLSLVLPRVLVDLANQDRIENNLPPLVISAKLELAAEEKANDMIAKGYFAHTSPEGLSPWYWFTNAEYAFLYAGENLAVDFNDSEDVENAWMISPAHRANILNSNFTEIGIATAKTTDASGNERIFVVQLFGAPKAIALAPSESNIQTEEIDEPEVIPSPSEEIIPNETPINILGEEVETQEANDMFIAVSETEIPESPAVLSENINENKYSSGFERFLSTPRRILIGLYSALALLIFGVMFAVVTIEFKKHHIKHLLYGTTTIIIIGILFFITRALFFSQTLVI